MAVDEDCAGYAPARVRQYCHEHGRVREDGRVMRLAGKVLPESHRNTIANWALRGVDPIPLGRWDEILLASGVMLWSYEDWEQRTFGDVHFVDCNSSL
jgi:hypothetical protein